MGPDDYRWKISSSSKGLLVFTAEHADEQGQIIRIYIKSDVNEYWVEFPHVDKLNVRIIKSADVSMIISQAVSLGWNPRRKGPPLTFTMNGDSIELRNP